MELIIHGHPMVQIQKPSNLWLKLKTTGTHGRLVCQLTHLFINQLLFQQCQIDIESQLMSHYQMVPKTYGQVSYRERVRILPKELWNPTMSTPSQVDRNQLNQFLIHLPDHIFHSHQMVEIPSLRLMQKTLPTKR